MKINKSIILVFLVFINLTSKAQLSSNKLDVFQDSLIKISEVIRTGNDETKLAANGKFVKTLIEALKTTNSFNYPFDSLKNVSVIKSSDRVFRTISWYVQMENGTYRYYGAIQMNTNNGSLKLFPLMDQTENIADENLINSNQKWLGARYYEIIPVTSSSRLPYYILLGWKGNNPLTSKKIIEILSFNKDSVNFGAAVFDGKDMKGKNRVVFEYAKSNAMLLKTDLKAGMIVFDHLAPIDPAMKGKFDYYVSDGSFDGFKIIGGRLKLQENIELKNDPNLNDDLYADPSKKLIPEKKF